MLGLGDEKNPNFFRDFGYGVDKRSDSSFKELAEHGDFGDSASSHHLHWMLTLTFIICLNPK